MNQANNYQPLDSEDLKKDMTELIEAIENVNSNDGLFNLQHDLLHFMNREFLCSEHFSTADEYRRRDWVDLHQRFDIFC